MIKDKYSVLKKTKKLRVPERTNKQLKKNSSLLLGSFFESENNLAELKVQPKKEFLVGDLMKKNNRRLRHKEVQSKRREIVLEKIKQEFTPERASLLGKKGRGRFRSQFTDFEYSVFCEYIRSCRRGRVRFQRKAKKKKVRGRTSYENFINSPEWAAIRNRYWRGHPKKCAVCDTASYIHLHHMVYGEFGQEKDEDLIPLCKNHHEEYHAQNGTQRDMRNRTMEFVGARKRIFIAG